MRSKSEVVRMSTWGVPLPMESKLTVRDRMSELSFDEAAIAGRDQLIADTGHEFKGTASIQNVGIDRRGGRRGRTSNSLVDFSIPIEDSAKGGPCQFPSSFPKTTQRA